MENDREEASDTTRRKLSEDGSTTSCDTWSIFNHGMLTEREYSMTVNDNTHTNYETVQVAYEKYNDSESESDSKWDMEYSDFVLDNEDIPNFHAE